MRRLFLALALSLAASASHAADLYFHPFENLYSVHATGGTPQLVLSSSEVSIWGLGRMTRFNHAGSNGQALVQMSGGYNDSALVYRASDGTVVVRAVTDFQAGNTLKPWVYHALAQDDSFFSLTAKDSAGRYTLWRLNVTVDQALAPDYVPPTSFDDPRLQLVLDVTSPNLSENFPHTWSPDGTRVAYIHRWTDAGGTALKSVRVKNLVPGYSTSPDGDVRLADSVYSTSTWMAVLEWSPTTDQIVNADTTGGIWMVHADSPGVFTWVAQARTYKSGGSTITEQVSLPRWSNDGTTLAVSYYKKTQSRRSSVVNHYPALLTNGWPVQQLTTTSSGTYESSPMGWTP